RFVLAVASAPGRVEVPSQAKIIVQPVISNCRRTFTWTRVGPLRFPDDPILQLKPAPGMAADSIAHRHGGVLLLHPRGSCSGSGYSVPIRHHLRDPIRPPRGHTAISPQGGLYAMPSLCGNARKRVRSLTSMRHQRGRGATSARTTLGYFQCAN